MSADILATLDDERRASGEPAPVGGVVREYSADRSECRVVYSHNASEDVIGSETARAESEGYALEWKLYAHDVPADLRDRLLAAGFEPGDAENVLVVPVSANTLNAFGPTDYRIRRITDKNGLEEVAEIARQIGRRNVESERRELAAVLRDTPEAMSIYVAYVDGEPAASGRVYFRDAGTVAELAGGRTKTTHRKRGLLTALVAARMGEALARGRSLMFLDALPASERTLTKRGFRVVTQTQPFVYQPRDGSGPGAGSGRRCSVEDPHTHRP